MNTPWLATLKDKITQCREFENPNHLIETYNHAFSADYMNHFTAEDAIKDIKTLELLSSEKEHVGIEIYKKESNNRFYTHVKIFQLNDLYTLSYILPILDNFGIEVISEYSYEVKVDPRHTVHIADFKIRFSEEIKLTEDLQEAFQTALIKTINHECENDKFNFLVLHAKLRWNEVNIIRAYSKYLHQTLFNLSQSYIENVTYKYKDITRLLVALFLQRNDLNTFTDNQANIDRLESEIKTEIDNVQSLDDDRILRRFWSLINATLRTNYFQTLDDGSRKPYLSLKIESSKVPELPKPIPAYETFVYSPRFEGIHLRSSKIARGGLRWSDRLEDYRTEILGLMKAQKVKNTIIVPTGAKGGFVIKRGDQIQAREAFLQEGTECYKLFISGLLDLTDNIIDGKVIPPVQVRCYDDHDTYFVVAADKGTSTFSDVANKIAESYNYWLGDAFASGGSQGYDHKAMGITARGAWESIKRNLLELGINLDNEAITVAGIGDMSGDVFGNGMLYHKNIKLVAAFNHRHIFLDPNPDTKSAYREREKLFNRPGSSWDDYDKSILSKGGEIYSRDVKSIDPTPEIRKLLDIKESSVSPNDLIKYILRAKVDVLYNGGIGTYVKASHEHDDQVGDKANKAVRVNANELKCRSIGEGGNLGLTQPARIEYALNGGLVNSDFIDNSAGVDCSDHEVNLKILLKDLLVKGKMSMPDRNQLLVNLKDEVATQVLKNNYYQALVISYSSYHSAAYIDLYKSHITKLEACAGLSREIEHLPSDKILVDRKSQNQGLTRPELATLLAYSKLHVKSEILKSNLNKNDFAKTIIYSAFPPSVRDKYSQEIESHYLQKEIVATQISSYMLNKMGITFPYRLQNETGASLADVALAFLVVNHIFQSDKLQSEIDNHENNIPIKVQYELLHIERQLVNMATRWFLRSGRLHQFASFHDIKSFKTKIDRMVDIIPPLLEGEYKTNESRLMNQLVKIGLSEKTAKRFASSRSLFAALDIIDIANAYNLDLNISAKLFFSASKELGLIWMRDKLLHDKRVGLWNSLSRLALRESLDNVQKRITCMAIHNQPSGLIDDQAVHQWAIKHETAVERWKDVLNQASSSNTDDYKLLFIALHELNCTLDSIQIAEEKFKSTANFESSLKETGSLAVKDPFNTGKEPAY